MFQFFKGGFPGGTYSIDNASATFHDAHITVAVEPPDEFVGAKSSENQMGMRINESRQQYIPSGIKHFIAGLFMAYTVFANIGNNAVGYSYRSARNVEKFVHGFSFPSGSALRSNDVGIDDNQVVAHNFVLVYSMIRASSTCCMEKFSNPR